MEWDEHRSTSDVLFRSTESAASCETVSIMTHEEFAAKHPNQPKPFIANIDRDSEQTADQQRDSTNDRQSTSVIDQRAPLFYRQSEDAAVPMQVDQATVGRTLRNRKEKVPKHLKRGANDKEMECFRKRILRIPLDKPFEEAYFTHKLWMFFKETKETEEDIRRMFNQVREKKKQRNTLKKRITLKKKSDPEKFVVPCFIRGIDYPSALCDTGSSVSILPKVMADHLGLKIEPSEDSFTFVDCSQKNS
ncbi:hypothetical protein DY000_02031557 [Brassica cretica]|uniref:Aspartic peptidase DDI1-type domain-containing protein n=1 Tax=Brassica cretica TaxID=69181 RepID=A0ABQ7DVZ2_BRACR|nr:hypothetical protein DY000_02031557 [Brassica cretica]